jgi:hypothetical protein
MDSGETASDSEFSDRDEYDCETDASSSQVRLRLSGSDVHRTLRMWARQLEPRVPIRCSLVRRQPHASAMTALHQPEPLAATSPAAGTLCPRCQKQIPKLPLEYNLKEHQKSKTCKREQTADPSSNPNLLSGFNESPLPLSTTESADKLKEPSRAAAPSSSRAAEETAASKKRRHEMRIIKRRRNKRRSDRRRSSGPDWMTKGKLASRSSTKRLRMIPVFRV